jgi:hypothetical protein
MNGLNLLLSSWSNQQGLALRLVPQIPLIFLFVPGRHFRWHAGSWLVGRHHRAALLYRGLIFVSLVVRCVTDQYSRVRIEGPPNA